MSIFKQCLVAACAAASLIAVVPSFSAEADRRRIEEVVVTAEKREATVSDTSISITAFSQSMIENMGIQNADEMVNFIPATTRDAYDIRIRGVGRNFRALGGDPGVATYYNGVYSEDFGIASSESALFDIARIEVLRGPQGTLYGRNSVGGALNYITNKPTYDTEIIARGMVGNFDTKEFYGVVSGPLIADRLAYRLIGVRRDRDGAQKGIDGSEDVNSIGDQNLAVALNWQITDGWEFNVRWNDRRSDRIIGSSPLVTEGPITAQGPQTRGVRSVDTYALGIVPVPGALFGGAVPYTGPTMDFRDPTTGAIVSGIYARPGVDYSAVSRPNAAFGTNPDVFDPDIKNLKGYSLTDDRNDEQFDQQGLQADLSWDISDTTELKWIGGWQDFVYTFHIDSDDSTSDLTSYHQLVRESVETFSNELQLLWQIGDNLQMTSGVYQFRSKRRQQYSVNDDTNQGRWTRPVNYGFMAPFVTGPFVTLGDAAPGTSIFGRADGTGSGLLYGIDNKVDTDAYAAYTQGTYSFNEDWSLTVGVRWAQDEKRAREQRGGYLENNLNDPNNGFYAFSNPVFEGFCQSTYGVPSCAFLGLTQIAVMNMFMGNASFTPTLNPNMPITPTCALDDRDCATPLRLQGLPISWADASEPGKETWSKVTYRVNADWTPTDRSLIYFGVTSGYRSGGYSLGLLGTQSQLFDASGNPISGRTGQPRTYDEEDVTAYEIGYKGSLLDGRLQLFSALYRYDYKGYQDEVEEFQPQTGSARNVVINAGKAENLGWEIEGLWLATDNWTIGGNYSYTQTEYKSDILIVEDDDPAVPNTLLPPKVVNLKGNDLKRIPRHKATLFSWYDWSFSPGVFSLGGSASYTGAFWDTGIKRDLDKVPSRNRIDVYAGWRDHTDTWNVRAFVDNVTDEGAARGIATPTASSNWRQSATFLYPRFYGLDVTYRFSKI
jgi:iron complex outermembrane recepter protein